MICRIGDCGTPVGPSGAKGLCQRHYRRMRRYGDPEAPTQRGPLAERFARRVTPGAPDECWEWQGLRDKDGYGMMTEGKRNRRASRVQWKLVHGQYPPSHIFVCHHCDNPPCVNPAHLFLGTVRDNGQDAARKGRIVGPKPGRRRRLMKLTSEEVAAIKAAGAPHRGAIRDLAAQYGVSDTHIIRIQTGKQYRSKRRR